MREGDVSIERVLAMHTLSMEDVSLFHIRPFPRLIRAPCESNCKFLDAVAGYSVLIEIEMRSGKWPSN